MISCSGSATGIFLVGASMKNSAAILAVTFLVAAAATTANAGNFGDHYVSGAQVPGMKGTRSSISSPGWNISADNGELAIIRVAAETNSNGIIQTGYGTITAHPFDSCGTRASNTTYYEYKATGGNFTCQWLTTFGNSGTDYKYSVIRNSNCTTCWYVFIGGNLQYSSGALGFSEADSRIYGGGEFNNPFGSTTIGGLTYGGYGIWPPPTDTPWQRTNEVYSGSVNWITIQQGNTTNTDGKWSITAMPSPYSVSH